MSVHLTGDIEGAEISAIDLAYEIIDDLGLADRRPEQALAVHRIVRFLIQGHRRLGAPISTCQIEDKDYINQCKVKKPCNLMRLDRLYVINHVGDLVTPQYVNNQAPYKRTPGYREAVDRNSARFLVHEREDYWEFSSNAEGLVALIRYKAAKLDSAGLPLLAERYKDYYMYFVKSRLAVMENSSPDVVARWDRMARQEAQLAYSNYITDNIDRERVAQTLARYHGDDTFFSGNFYEIARQNAQMMAATQANPYRVRNWDRLRSDYA